jgi:hypothetical protein
MNHPGRVVSGFDRRPFLTPRSVIGPSLGANAAEALPGVNVNLNNPNTAATMQTGCDAKPYEGTRLGAKF